ncbi:transmembrane amino acid transporter [Rhizodiscina lignyota]|uniref:Transmembrane amino acid transporter n=1 Tax=Rhizodiscina lignyota TaxID=1504668 RepID=A0A9P4II96_9PEZI|nr:transmembrane amino acid transporter [Rhizodiscina lignyota]
MTDRNASSSHSRAQAIPGNSPNAAGRLSPGDSSPSIRASATQRLGSPVPSHGYGTPPVRQVPTPGQLGTEQPSQAETPLPGTSTQRSSLPGPGESALSAALQGSFGGSPPRFGTPPLRPMSPASGAAEGRVPRSNYGSFDQRGNGGSAPYEDAEVVRRHLVGPRAGSPSNPVSLMNNHTSSLGGDQETASGLDEDDFSSLRLQGGDIHRQIYRWSEQQEAEGKTKRSKSFSLGNAQADDVLDINTIKQPGGFRRNYIRRNVASPSPSRADAAERGEQRPQLFTSNFIEFLSLYGHFAGEDLEDDEADGYFSSDTYGESILDEDQEATEETGLIRTPMRRKRRKDNKAPGATATGAAMMLLKSFVGTGVLFLPKAFLNGGMLFSTLVLLFVAALSYYCFILLVTTRIHHTYSFGGMGEKLYGPWLRHMINASLVISQIGFSSAYIVFTSENLQAFILAVSKCRTFIPIGYLILMQMIIFLPFSLYRNIAKIQNIAIVADVFIVLGLVYLFYYDILTIATVNHGIADITWFNEKSWTLFIGTAIFTFEGIGLIIPIQEAMRDQTKLPLVLGLVMIICAVIFSTSGILSYAAYGSKTKTVVLLNMPQDNKFVNAVQFIYSLAIMLSTPLQFHPAIDITSKQLFRKTGKNNPTVKWSKNFFRFFMVCFCAMIAWAGANDLDKFVALVGSFACIPLVYIYPPMLHYRGVSRTRNQRIADIVLIIFGCVGMVYTTVMTIRGWLEGGDVKPPGYCDQGKRAGL